MKILGVLSSLEMIPLGRNTKDQDNGRKRRQEVQYTRYLGKHNVGIEESLTDASSKYRENV